MVESEAPPAWFTEARWRHENALVVGARVRVTLSGECPARHDWMNQTVGVIESLNWSADLGEEPLCGDPEVDGYVHHWYIVAFDTPVQHPTEHRPIVADLFAAEELVIIAPDPV